MAGSELDSFMGKFKQLCLAGISATLSVDCQRGKTTIDLKAELTTVEADKSNVIGKPRSPAYYRRKSRRLTSRLLSDGFKLEGADQASRIDESIDIKEKEDRSKNNEVENVDTILLQKSDCEVNLLSPLILTDNGNSSDGSSTEKVCESLPLDCQLPTTEKCEPAEKVASGNMDVLEVVKESKSEFDTVCVNVTASLQYSPHKTVDDGTLESILGIVNNKDHLRRNIHDVTIGNIRNRQMWRSSNYEHEVEFTVLVLKNSLWESARSYLWKNLGTSTWTLNDGTELSFKKIHQK